MADKASIVAPNDKGQFAISVPRSSIDRVDVIDIDMVLHTKNGERLILPGAALEAMTAAPPAIHFSDGALGADSLLTSVDKVQTPQTSIPAMTSLTEFDQKRTEGKKNRTADGKADADAQEAQSQQVAALPTQGSESSVDKLIAKAESMEAEMLKGAFSPEPPKVHHPTIDGPPMPSPAPKTSKIPLYMSLSEANYEYESSHTLTSGGNKTVYGASGPTASNIKSGILPGDALQYGTETLVGGSGNDIFYADGLYNSAGWTVNHATVLNPQATYASLDKETGLAPSGTKLYYAKEITLSVAGYIRHLDTITISGLPAGVSIQGARNLGNGSWGLVEGDVTRSVKTLVLVYDTASIRTLFAADSDHLDVEMVVNITGLGATVINVTKKFILRFQDVDSTADVTNPPVLVPGVGGGWSDVYVMPTAGAPELILTYAGTYNTAQTFAQNASASAATADGNNTVYGGNSADTILAGAGNDTIYAYAGDDRISAGNGTNTVWAGDGNDTVYSGTDNDSINAGGGNNIIDTGNGVNVVTAGSGNDTVTTGTGNDTVQLGAGANVVNDAGGSNTISADANSGKNIISITAGTGADINVISTGGGDDTIVTGDSVDTIHAGDGDNFVWAINGTVTNGTGTSANSIDSGSGNDTLVGGNGVDSISAGAGDDWLYGGLGSNTMLDGGTNSNGSDENDWLSFNGVDRSDMSLSGWLRAASSGVVDVNFNADATGSDTTVEHNAGSSDSVANIENIIGTAGDDILNMSSYGSAKHILYGLAGDDTITGGAAADTIYAGAGQDTVLGGGGDDQINLAVTDITLTGSGLTGTTVDASGAGGLTVSVSAPVSATSGVTASFNDITNYADGGAGADTIIGGAGHDYFHVGLNETLNGSARDTFAGGAGDDTLDLTAFTATGLTVDMTTGTVKVGGTAYADFSSIERVLTSSGNDAVTGTDGDDSIWTGIGNDTIQVGRGANYVQAGAGNDIIDTDDTQSGNDTFYAGDGDDSVWTGRGNDTVWGGNGNDRLYAEYGSDTLYGEAGNDSFWGSATSTDHVILDGGSGSNYYYMNQAIETLAATAGWDQVRYGDSAVVGTVVSGANYGVFVNLDGSDHSLAYSASGATTLNGTSGTSYWWNGSNWTAQMTTTSVSNQTWTWVAANAELGLYGFADHDVYHGVEAVYGTGYSDVLIGNASANNFYASNGNDAMFGLDGNDWFQVNTAGSGHIKYIDGGIGIDTLDLSGITSSTPITINLATHTGTHIVYNVESVVGGSGDDILTGDANANTLNGGIGADTMVGGAGDDAFYVNSSSDVVSEVSGEGTDTVYTTINYTLAATVENLVANTTAGLVLTGNASANVITGNSGNDTINGGVGADTIDGSAGNDIIDGGTDADTMIGGAGNDVYYVDNTSDVLSEAVNAGTDTVYTSVNCTLTSNIEIMIATGTTGLTLAGNTLANTITGTIGNDIINGGDGNDIITGNGGADSLLGGNGNDTFNTTNAATVALFDGGAGTDTVVAANWTMSGLSTTAFTSIEAINLRGGAGTNMATAALDNTTIAGILDSSAGSRTLTIYLDTGDTFNATGSNASSAIAGGTHYTYTGATTYYVDVYKA